MLFRSDKLDYVIALDADKNIQGMLGFISYDNNGERDIATSMWKANQGTGFLGIKLLMFTQKNEPHRTLFSPGINVRTSGRIYNRMGITLGKMNQWYRLHKQSQYVVARIVDGNIPEILQHEKACLIRYNKIEDLLADFNFDLYVLKKTVPYKSLEYLKRRYFNHPSYNYLIYGVKADGKETSAVIVIKIQECDELRVLRFIDCIGDLSAIMYISTCLDNLLEKTNSEYIDMYEKGLDEKMLKFAGWTKLDETENIIPNYFTPYEQRNVEIHYCTTDDNIVLFKGDGDQDRPN